MTDRRDGSTDLGVDIPTLEPDDAFVGRLAELARRSAPAGPAAARQVGRGGWRVGVAAAAVAGVVGGGSWLAAAVTGTQAPAPPAPPATRPHHTGGPTLGRGATTHRGDATLPEQHTSGGDPAGGSVEDAPAGAPGADTDASPGNDASGHPVRPHEHQPGAHGHAGEHGSGQDDSGSGPVDGAGDGHGDTREDDRGGAATDGSGVDPGDPPRHDSDDVPAVG